MDQASLFLPFSFDFEKTFTIFSLFYLGLAGEQKEFFGFFPGPAAHELHVAQQLTITAQ